MPDMSKKLEKKFPDSIQKEYEESLKKIEVLCANEKVMETISSRLPNKGEIDDKASYMKNISETLDAWKEYSDDTWRI